MALELVRFAAPLKAKVDMSEKQYYAVKVSTGNFECDIATEDTEAIGVVQNNPKKDMSASVALNGVIKISVKSGSSIVAGSGVKITNGQADGEGLFGIALESCTGPCLATILLKQTPVERPTELTLSTSEPGAEVDLLGKTIADLQDDIEIGENSITGTLLYVADYSSAFTGEEASGNYIALKFIANAGATITVEVVGGVHGPKVLDEDGICIFRIASTSQKIKATASKEGYEDTVVEYSLTGLTLNQS